VQQKIYPFEEHQLPIDKVDPDALFVMQKLRQAGYVAYLVGGSVRDLLLNKTPKDFDISTSAEPEQIRRLFRNSILIGRRFRLAHIRFGQKTFEVSTFRSGNNEADTLIVRDNEWGSPEEDVLRRDFTINGLYYDSSNQTVIDYVDGYPDLEKKFLRTIGQPFLRFKQDPVRMLRLLKFRARFNFEIDHDAHIALLETRHEITKSSPARILEELLRMLESGSSRSFFQLLTDYGLLQLMLPEIASFLEQKEGEEIYSYLEEVDTNCYHVNMPPVDRAILLSCLLFPMLQKRIQTRYIDREKNPHLGEIQDAAHDLVSDVFKVFLQIPRKLRMEVVSVLTCQYRLTPIDKKKIKHLRIPNDPDFFLALQFLEIRSFLEPGLQKIWEEWQRAIDAPKTAPKKRRKRKPSPKTPPKSGE
jgi:poly(A) polymerase